MRAVAEYDAAGGVVFDDAGRVLVLHRPSRDEVRLPKGHVEPGETHAEAAVREVGEESGYVDVEITRDLGVQHVEFDLPDVHVVRDEHYFAMRLVTNRTIERDEGDQKFHPDWMPAHQAMAVMTFPIEAEWVRRAIADD